MANEIAFAANKGSVYYARIFNTTGQVWNTSGTPAFEIWANGNVTDYDIALVDMTSGEYIGDFPTCSAGRYRINIYKRAGASPAITDKVRGQGWILWDGTSEIQDADEDDITDAHAGILNIYDEST